MEEHPEKVEQEGPCSTHETDASLAFPVESSLNSIDIRETNQSWEPSPHPYTQPSQSLTHEISLNSYYQFDSVSINDNNEDDTSSSGNGFNFSNKVIRREFARKIYGIVSVQLLITASIITLFSFQEGVRGFLRQNSVFAIPIYLIAAILLLIIMFCEDARRESPWNLVLLGFFTLVYGLVIGIVAALYEPQTIALAAIVALLATIGLTAFAFQTKVEVIIHREVLLSLLLVTMLFLIFQWTIPSFNIARQIIACCGALIFSLFLVFEIQLIMDSDLISPKEYVFAVWQIYLDFILIFRWLCHRGR